MRAVGTVHDISPRGARRPGAPRGGGPPCDVVPLRARAAVRVEPGPVAGRVLLTVESDRSRGDATLDLVGALRLARGLRDVAEGEARRSGRLVVLRPTRPDGLPTAAAPERCLVVGWRDNAVHLEIVRTGRRAWFSTDTGEPVGADVAGLRLSASAAARLRTAPTRRHP